MVHEQFFLVVVVVALYEILLKSSGNIVEKFIVHINHGKKNTCSVVFIFFLYIIIKPSYLNI